MNARWEKGSNIEFYQKNLGSTDFFPVLEILDIKIGITSPCLYWKKNSLEAFFDDLKSPLLH
jgi:hypothetical protein